MPMARRAVLLAVGAGLGLAGCARQAPVYTATNVPFGGTAPERERALQIRRAGAVLGWSMEDAGPGRIRGTLDLRTHRATVDIPFDRQRFSILHGSSQNLDYTGATIHNNYNGWVQRLQQAIVAQSGI